MPPRRNDAYDAAALIAWLAASACLIRLGMRARREAASERLVWAGLLAMGSFSSLFVLTLVRDAALLAGAIASPLLLAPDALAQLERLSAAAVPALAALLTGIGFVNARRRARVLCVDVPIAGLPAPLHGFIIVQISDIHVGPTIKRDYLEAIVDAVNDLNADMIAVTGDLVDGSVRQLARHTQPLERSEITRLRLVPA